MSLEFPLARGGFQNQYGTRTPWTTETLNPSRRCDGWACTSNGESTCASNCAYSGTCSRTDPLLSAVLGRGGASKPSDATAPKKRELFSSEAEVIDAGFELNLTPDQVTSLVNERSRFGDRRSAVNQTIADIFAVTDVEFQIRQQLLQRDPGGTGRILGGRLINAALTDVDVPVGVDEDGNIFGSAALTLSQKRIDQLNGFGQNVVNSFLYSDGPGSAKLPFQRDVFLFDLGPAQSHPWADRIFQTVADVNCESNGLGLYVNGMVGRTLYLVRRPQPYYIIFRNPRCSPLLRGMECCYEDLDPCGDHGVYFTTDPVGGGECNFINGGVAPNVFPMSAVVRANTNSYSFHVNNSWPDVLFYQSTQAPFRGGLVLVFGQCP